MTSDDWESHKDTITCLYLLEKLTLQELPARMKAKYNFDKKKHQYEYQLKQWGIKKNLQSDDWRYISHRVQKRKKAGKLSTVTYFGMPLSKERVRKEIQRNTNIPTAEEFGRNIPCPPSPIQGIVRVVSPSPPESQIRWPGSLPWLQFLQHFDLSSLQMPSISDMSAAARAASSIPVTYDNPLTFYTTINRLFCLLPQACEMGNPDDDASVWTKGPWEIASASLKVILFHLANKDFHRLPFLHYWPLQRRDEFILWLLQCTNSTGYLSWSTQLVKSQLPTANAISEAIFGCAVRQRRYNVISDLLQAGVDPNIVIEKPRNLRRDDTSIYLERGKMKLSRAQSSYFSTSAIEVAVSANDLHLAALLLEAGADIGVCRASILQLIALELEDENALQFVQLFISYIPDPDILPSLGIAIAKRRDRLAEFLVEELGRRGVSEQLVTYNFEVRDKSYGRGSFWYDERFQLLKIHCTLLHIATLSENTTMVATLFKMSLDAWDIVFTNVLRGLFMVASLAGDRTIIEHLVNLNMSWVGDWTLGFSPLAASAWNPDIGVTEMILGSGAFLDNDINTLATSSEIPLPIHVAACSGNTNLVEWLLNNGRCIDIQFKPPRNRWPSIWHWLVPSRQATPFLLALGSGSIATVLRCCHAKLIGGELIQAVKMGYSEVVDDILSRGVDFGFVDPCGATVLEAAIQTRNFTVLAQYFSQGGKYRSSALLEAVQAAVVSQDNSIIQLLITHRPIRKIDRYEASALVIAVRKGLRDVISALLTDPFRPRVIQSFYKSFHFNRDHFQFDRNYFQHGRPSWNTSLTPFCAALGSGDLDIVENFLQAGYLVHPRDLKRLWSLTARNRAAVNFVMSRFPPTKENPQWTQQLLFWSMIESPRAQSIKECINCLDNLEFYVESRTPLQKAVEDGDVSLVTLLLDAGANIDGPAASVAGATALQLAAIHGQMTMARLLLERGANIDAPAAKLRGRTALEGASEHGKLDMAQLLLENSITLNGAQRIHYIRAVKFASHEGHLALSNLLRSHGSWEDRDQVISDREEILRDDGYFVYDEDEDTHEWRFRRVIHVQFSEDKSSDSGSYCSYNTCKTVSDECVSDPVVFRHDELDFEDNGNVFQFGEYEHTNSMEFSTEESRSNSETGHIAAREAEDPDLDIGQVFNDGFLGLEYEWQDGEQVYGLQEPNNSENLFETNLEDMGLMMERYLNDL
ncbi:ankyrin repeat-containing domain protein [Nemania sp. FL0916]|nr:ankyrin repeat-containing domain protein [Nemania sp. FL0916]